MRFPIHLLIPQPVSQFVGLRPLRPVRVCLPSAPSIFRAFDPPSIAVCVVRSSPSQPASVLRPLRSAFLSHPIPSLPSQYIHPFIYSPNPSYSACMHACVCICTRARLAATGSAHTACTGSRLVPARPALRVPACPVGPIAVLPRNALLQPGLLGLRPRLAGLPIDQRSRCTDPLAAEREAKCTGRVSRYAHARTHACMHACASSHPFACVYLFAYLCPLSPIPSPCPLPPCNHWGVELGSDCTGPMHTPPGRQGCGARLPFIRCMQWTPIKRYLWPLPAPPPPTAFAPFRSPDPFFTARL